MSKTVTETVAFQKKIPANRGQCEPGMSILTVNIPLELQAERQFCSVGHAGLPPLKGTHIVVCCNRWYSEVETFVLFNRGKVFLFYKKKEVFSCIKRCLPT